MILAVVGCVSWDCVFVPAQTVVLKGSRSKWNIGSSLNWVGWIRTPDHRSNWNGLRKKEGLRLLYYNLKRFEGIHTCIMCVYGFPNHSVWLSCVITFKIIPGLLREYFMGLSFSMSSSLSRSALFMWHLNSGTLPLALEVSSSSILLIHLIYWACAVCSCSSRRVFPKDIFYQTFSIFQN